MRRVVQLLGDAERRELLLRRRGVQGSTSQGGCGACAERVETLLERGCDPRRLLHDVGLDGSALLRRHWPRALLQLQLLALEPEEDQLLPALRQRLLRLGRGERARRLVVQPRLGAHHLEVREVRLRREGGA